MYLTDYSKIIWKDLNEFLQVLTYIFLKHYWNQISEELHVTLNKCINRIILFICIPDLCIMDTKKMLWSYFSFAALEMFVNDMNR